MRVPEAERAIERVAILGGVELQEVELVGARLVDEHAHDLARQALPTMVCDRVHVEERTGAAVREARAGRLLDEQEPRAAHDALVGVARDEDLEVGPQMSLEIRRDLSWERRALLLRELPKVLRQVRQAQTNECVDVRYRRSAKEGLHGSTASRAVAAEWLRIGILRTILQCAQAGRRHAAGATAHGKSGGTRLGR